MNILPDAEEPDYIFIGNFYHVLKKKKKKKKQGALSLGLLLNLQSSNGEVELSLMTVIRLGVHTAAC